MLTRKLKNYKILWISADLLSRQVLRLLTNSQNLICIIVPHACASSTGGAMTCQNINLDWEAAY